MVDDRRADDLTEPMESNRTKLVFTLSWLLFWSLMITVAVQDYIKSPNDGELWKPILWESSSFVVATSLMITQRYSTRRYDAFITQPWKWFAIQSLWLPVYWISFVPLAFGIRIAVYSLAGEHYSFAPLPHLFFYEDLKITVFIGLFTVIHFGILSYRELLEERLRAARAHSLLQQAQLQRLSQQMQPHFLFNALNTISSLMHTDVRKADATLTQLATLLRTSLDMGGQDVTSLDNELRLVRGYAAVMSERFADRVTIDWRIDEGALCCKLPSMSVQPLLENVFKHTVERRRQATHVVVSADAAGGVLSVSVEDDGGVLDAASRPGIGLSNLRERLATLYGDQASLSLTQRAPAGVRAELRLPCGC
jgi:two-component system, LytTR family, sensor kinase